MINWNDLQQKYPPAVKQLCDGKSWTINGCGDLVWGLKLRIQPFEVLCALDEEGIIARFDRRPSNGLWWFEIYDSSNSLLNRLHQSDAVYKGRRESATAAIPHPVKAYNDKLEAENG